MPKWKHGTAKNQFEAAMRRSAERRRCPQCDRKSAMVRVESDPFISSYCRWDDCGYVRRRKYS
jgi:hypothetical protein